MVNTFSKSDRNKSKTGFDIDVPTLLANKGMAFDHSQHFFKTGEETSVNANVNNIYKELLLTIDLSHRFLTVFTEQGL